MIKTPSLTILFSAVRFGRVPKREKAKINAAMESSRLKNMENRVMAELADDAKIIETVVRAHFDTCDYTEEKIKPFIAKAKEEKQFTQCTGMVSTAVFFFHQNIASCIAGLSCTLDLIKVELGKNNLCDTFTGGRRWLWYTDTG